MIQHTDDEDLPSYPVHNWREPATYDRVKFHSLRAWGWEFLRRNPVYNAAWTAKLNAALETELIQSPQETLPGCENVLKDWGIKVWISPETQSPVELDFDPAPEFLCSKDHVLYKEGITRDTLISKELAFSIDLSVNIDQQLRQIADEAKELQKHMGIVTADNRNRSNNWINYLRVLDADSMHIKAKTVAKIIYPKLDDFQATQKHRDTLKQAKEWRDIKFKELLLKVN